MFIFYTNNDLYLLNYDKFSLFFAIFHLLSVIYERTMALIPFGCYAKYSGFFAIISILEIYFSRKFSRLERFKYEFTRGIECPK